MRFRLYSIGLVLTVVLVAGVGCSASAPTATDAGHADERGDHDQMVLPEIAPVELADGEKLGVVATTSIIGDVVSNVGGDAIDLRVLMEIGQNPHSYEPAPQALAAVEDADIVFVNGLNLEEVLMESVENIATGAVVPVSTGIDPLDFPGGDADHEGDDHEHTAGDPHVWIDPNNVMMWVENIVHVLVEADPANRETYEANAEAYMGELEAVDAYIREQVETIPEANRKLVTDHKLFGYFADEYGFEVVGALIPSFSTTAGASAGDVADLVELIREENVPAIFTGTTASQGLKGLAEAIADEAGLEIKVLPVLTGSLAPAGEPGDTYIGYMRYNIDQIAAGLSE